MLVKTLRKLTVLAVAAGLIFSLFSLMAAKASAQDPNQGQLESHKFGRVLIIYYSLSGNTKQLADTIQHFTGGDLYALQTRKVYPEIPAIYEVIRQELKDNDWPELKTGWPDFAQYDVIFVGGPVWWYTLPTPLLSFLQKANFQGKTVVPFCSHGGNYGDFFKRFTQLAQNARIVKGLDFYAPLRVSNGFLNSKLANWLSQLQAPGN